MSRNRFIIKQKSFLWAVILTVFFFQNELSTYFEVIKYFDEIIALICLAYFVLETYKTGLGKIDLKIAIVVVVLCVLGFLGNAMSGIQDSIKYQVFDAFNVFKFVMTVWGALLYFRKYSTKKYLLRYLAYIVKVSVLISSFFMVLNLFVDIGMHTDYRWGLRTFHFIFSRVGEFYNICIVWLLVLSAKRFYEKSESDLFYMALVLINMCSTMRSRAFAYAVLFVAVYYFIIKGKKFKLRWYQLVLIAAILFLVGKDQIVYYLLRESAARSVLLQYGIITAITYFPLGAGFGTYGTAVARDTYSDLYVQYEFHNTWGLDQGEGFLTDNYWPAIMGEFGFFGMLLNVILLYLIIRKLLAETDNPYSKVCVYFAVGTLLISSVAASSFFSCTRLMLFICLVCKLDYTSKEIKVIV